MYENCGINQIDYMGNNSLILALKKHYNDIAKLLIIKKIKNINYIDKHGDSALSCALRYNYLEIVDLLLEIKDINVNHIDKHGDSILLIMIDHLQEEYALNIVENFKVNINYVNHHGFDSLTLSITKRLKKLAKLLIEKGVNSEFINNTGDTSLIYALNNDFADIAQDIINNNKNNSTINKQGDTAFFHAIIKCDENLAKDIFSKGESNFELINSNNDSSLILSLTNNLYSLSYLLIKYGSKEFVKHTNQNFDNALFLCMNKGQWHLVHEIIEKKYYDINTQNIEGDTTLFLSINFGVEELCLKMFDDNEDDIDVNVINNDGNTLLMCAVICGMRKLSEKILKKINIHNLNFQNKHLDNILMICINLKYFELVDKILDFEDIDINIINKYGDTPLILLLNEGKIELCKKILKIENNIYIDHISDSGLCARNMIRNFPDLVEYN